MSRPNWDLDQLQRAARAGGVRAWLDDAGIDTVHLGIFDASGVLREKRMGAAAAARAMEDGWSFIDAIEWWGPADEVRRTGGSEHQPAQVDLTSGRPYPFEPRAALFLAEFEEPLAQLSPRHQMSRMVQRASGLGLEPVMGWEFECIVLTGTAGNPVPAMPDNRCWSAQTMAADAVTLADLARTLEEGAVPLDHICAELGPGCLELATAHGPAGRAADDAGLTKLFTRAFFARRGEAATFMAQLGEGFPGLGGHPSLSLRSGPDGSSAWLGPDGELSRTALSAIAGVVELLPELLGLVAPNPNSYRRFAPGNWAPSTATWGIGNYSCALRVVPGGATSSRLELRIPGADVSPHHGAAMFLGAALWGIEHDLEPPPPLLAPEDGRDHVGGRPLPRDPAEAADLLVKSAAAHALFGTPFVEHCAASLVAEHDVCRRFVSEQERLRYLQHV